MSATSTPGTQSRRGRSCTGFGADAERDSARSRRRSPLVARRAWRVTLALAHTIQRAIDRGEIRDQAEAARRLGVTRARMTQILDLTHLAPDVQEEILFLPTTRGIEPLSDRALRIVHSSPLWADQRSRFDTVCPLGS